MKLVFATNNTYKLHEINKLINGLIQILSLKEINCNEDIPETGETLLENASQKARYIFDKYKMDCFADDTGLEVKALGGEPGVYSARYAGDDKSAQKNMEKVLRKLKGVQDRRAQFRTVITLILKGKEISFEGIVKGQILEKERGDKGFGYDPVFLPDGFDQSFAEMDLAVKNSISHRGKAVEKFVVYLKEMLK